MKLIAAALGLLLIAIFARAQFFSFKAQSPEDYATAKPQIDLKTHLSGKIVSEGLIFGPNGKMTSSFVAEMEGEWTGETGTLSEQFTYSTGATQSRKWFLTSGPGNSFTATADDLVGPAKGIVSGSTIRMDYRITLPESAGGHTLDVVDWLYLTQDGVIMNKSEMRKFGVKVAELVATMRRAPD